MSYIAKLGQEFGQYVVQLTGQLLLSNQHPKSLSEMERQIREMLLKLGQFLLGAWLAMQGEPYPAESIPCPCGGQAQYEFRREGVRKFRFSNKNGWNKAKIWTGYKNKNG